VRTLTSSQFATLTDMLTYCRPHGSATDLLFCAKFIAPLPGIRQDAHGNWIGDIGTNPSVLWSSHTDTVHRSPGRQTVAVTVTGNTEIIRLSRKSRHRNCLGADDTVGVFLMREMYMAGVPGRYIFHYGEESGCIGSSDIANESPETLDGILYAIALDRAGTSDVVTSQMGDTCCSPAFVTSMIAALGLPYSGASGVFTDTAEYMRIVPECTNLSVGYYHQHSSREYVDASHVGVLLSALVRLDQSTLVCERNPHERPIRNVSPIFTRTIDTSVRDWDSDDWEYHSKRNGGITKIDGHTPVRLYRESFGFSDWCLTCDAPIMDADDPDVEDFDHCVCPRDEDTRGMTDEDVKFLRYLRGLD
jgi:hypothetical protein